MKNKFVLFTFFISAIHLSAQVSWTKMASLPGEGRNHAIAFSHGTKGYVLTGEGNTTSYLKDFWEYDSGTNAWTQLPNFPGSARSYGEGKVIVDKAFVGLGHSGPNYFTDWWQYDFTNSTWTQKNNFPGAGRNHPTACTLNGKIYMGFGDNASGSLNDWWQYDPNSDTWAQKTKYPGTNMHHPVSTTDGNLIYLSEGHLEDNFNNTGSIYFYSYNTTTDKWTQLANMPGPGVVAGASLYIGDNKVYSGCGITEPAGAFHEEWYAYDISGGTWNAITNYPGNGVFGPVYFDIGNAGYVATGMASSGTSAQDLYKLSVSVALDAGIFSISSPNGMACNTTFSPIVKIQNFGSTTLTSCTINYKVDNNSNQTFSWAGSLASNASANVTLPSITVTAGTHTFISSTSNPNGNSDGNPSNDQSQSIFTVAASGASLPLQESFENSTSIPSGWTINDMSSDGFAWTVNTSVSGFGNGTHCMEFDNCAPQTDITGARDRFITVPYDFTNAVSAAMTFDAAYTYLVLSSTTYTDTLVVYSSTDCGATWNSVYTKGGAQLSTAPNLTQPSPTCFSPASSQWRTENVNLNSLAGQLSVMFAFENRSDWAEPMFLDNINITAVTGITENNFISNLSIYPNPASTQLSIEGFSNAKRINYSLLNALGEEVKTGAIFSSGIKFSTKLEVNELPRGVYFLKMNDEKNIFTQKIFLQ